MLNKLLQYWRWVAIGIFAIIGVGVGLQPQAATVQARAWLRPLAYQSPIGNPQLAIDKQVSDPQPVSGDTITYTLRYSDTQAGSQAFNVYVYDFLPAGLNYLSANPAPASVNNNTLIFTAPSIGPATDNTTITVRARVAASSGSLLNHSLIVADGVAPATASALLTVQSIPQEYKLTLSKNGPTAILSGGTMDYTLRCQNTGTAPVDGVVVMDVLPANVTYASASPAPDATTPTLTWNVGRLNVGEIWTAVLTTTAPTTTGWLTNTAIAAGQQVTMTSAVLSTKVLTHAAILDVTKTGSPASLHVGDTVVYTIRYRNTGNEAASGVVLTDTFPANIHVTGIEPLTPFTQEHAVWNIGALAVGASGTVTVTATVTGGAGSTLHNEADISGSSETYAAHADVYTTVEAYKLYLPLITKNP